MVAQHVHGVPVRIQGNMVTRHVFTLGVLGNEVGEKTFVARMGPRRLAEIEAGERILEAPRGRLWSTHRTSVASLLQECKFELKSFKNVALIIGHGYASARQSPTSNGRPTLSVHFRYPIL